MRFHSPYTWIHRSKYWTPVRLGRDPVCGVTISALEPPAGFCAPFILGPAEGMDQNVPALSLLTSVEAFRSHINVRTRLHIVGIHGCKGRRRIHRYVSQWTAAPLEYWAIYRKGLAIQSTTQARSVHMGHCVTCVGSSVYVSENFVNSVSAAALQWTSSASL